MATSGGNAGMHPGKPIIWPTSKSSASSSSSSSSASSASSSSSSSSSGAGAASSSASDKAASSAASSGTGPTGVPQDPAAAEAARAAAQKALVSRPVTVSDIKQQLRHLQIPESNVPLATLMVRRVVELSRANIVKLLKMLDGSDKNSLNNLEAAITVLMKGENSPQAMKTVSSFLQENPKLANQMQSLLQDMANLSSAMANIKAASSNTTLFASLASTVSQLEKMIKDMPNNPSMSRDELVNNIRAFKALLSGVQAQPQEAQKSNDASSSAALANSLQAVTAKLDAVLKNYASQAILSNPTDKEEVNYQYQQIPNAFGKSPNTTELIVHRDGGYNAKVDPDKLRFLIALEPEGLGKMTILVTTKEKNAGVLFNTRTEATKKAIEKNLSFLKEQFSNRGFIVTNAQVKQNPLMCNASYYLNPPHDIRDPSKVSIEA